jgi:predicted ATPase
VITLVEALDFRCLRHVRQRLDAMHVLVGPNASGKTTFLDVIGFLGRLVAHGPEVAIGERTRNFADLTWGRHGSRFELAIEACIPPAQRALLGAESAELDTIRYEVACGTDPQTGENGILGEFVYLKTSELDPPRQLTIFPNDQRSRPTTILYAADALRNSSAKIRMVAAKHQRADQFRPETFDYTPERRFPLIRLGPRKSALANILPDEAHYPSALWLQSLLVRGVQSIVLNSLLIRQASPPGQAQGFKPDGSNLPWEVARLEREAPERFNEWLLHLNTALPDLVGVRVVEREDDRHRYLMLKYRGDLEVPSWVVSDGTLRLLALTLPAYLPDFRGVYLIEEPENGIHPRAVETMFQSLTSVYDAQILLATHSPVILSLADADSILCFAKSADGATDIVTGREHPALQDWRGEVNLGVLFASGVLG